MLPDNTVNIPHNHPEINGFIPNIQTRHVYGLQSGKGKAYTIPIAVIVNSYRIIPSS